MAWLKWIVVALALLEAGWMVFDGARALIVGDYVTPQRGEYAGQLGPWSRLVSAAGIDPRSTLMKAIFAGYGALWLLVIIAFALNQPWARGAMLAAAVGTLWYLPIGTVFSLTQIALLLVSR